MEFSLLCGIEVLLVIRDKNTNRALLYNSIDVGDTDLFNETIANTELTQACTNTDVTSCIIHQYEDIFGDGDDNSEKKLKGLKALKETGTKQKKSLKRAMLEDASFREKLKEKGVGLKIDITKTSSALKEEGEMYVTEEEKISQQIESSANQCIIRK